MSYDNYKVYSNLQQSRRGESCKTGFLSESVILQKIYLQYWSELSGHLFFDNCLNYPNLNYISEKICSLN